MRWFSRLLLSALERLFDWSVCWLDWEIFVGFLGDCLAKAVSLLLMELRSFLASCLETVAVAGDSGFVVHLQEILSSLFHITGRETVVAVVSLRWTAVVVATPVLVECFALVFRAQRNGTLVQATVVSRFCRLAAVEADKFLFQAKFVATR